MAYKIISFTYGYCHDMRLKRETLFIVPSTLSGEVGRLAVSVCTCIPIRVFTDRLPVGMGISISLASLHIYKWCVSVGDIETS